MRMLFGALLGALAAWLYTSERGRTLTRQGLSAAAEGAQRASEVIDAAPLPEPVKGPASDAAFTVWAAADQLGQAPPPTTAAAEEPPPG